MTKKNSKKKGNHNKKPGCILRAVEDEIWVDPDRVLFQHARIRPVFSSCGRTLTETLESIRTGAMGPDDLPPIQVSRSNVKMCGTYIPYPSLARALIVCLPVLFLC
jgi:hypothetical protein